MTEWIIKLVGTPFRTICAEQKDHFKEILKRAGPHGMRAEFDLQPTHGNRVPVQLSIYPLGTEEMSGIAILATDISERIQAEEKIRSLASELTRAEQEERHRISQVLHDDLQQRLFATKAQLSFLKDVKLSADTYWELDQIQESLSESIAITRNLSIDLSPIVLQREGLTEAMTWLAFRMKEQYGLHVELDAKERFDHLDNHVRMLLFRSVRELLFNVVKHAGVLHATVTLERTEENSRITVRDDGKGFDANVVMKAPQLAHGLLIIQDRLKLLGCHMNIISKPNQGTWIVIEIPTERASA
jgi:signal transduction histidine kinase